MTDENLRSVLAEVDPTAGEADLSEPRRAELVARAIATPQPRRRTSRVVVPITLAATSAFAVAVLLVGGVEDRGRPTTSIALDLGSTAGAQCAPVEDFANDGLRESSVAFRGVVTSVGSDTVTIQPRHFFRGGAADGENIAQVLLRTSGEGGEDLTQFGDGQSVLVAAVDGKVEGCGLSGTASEELTRIYASYFG